MRRRSRVPRSTFLCSGPVRWPNKRYSSPPQILEWPLSIAGLIFPCIYGAPCTTRSGAGPISPTVLDWRENPHSSLPQKAKIIYFPSNWENPCRHVSSRAVDTEALWLRDPFWCCLNMCYSFLSFPMGHTWLKNQKQHLHHGQDGYFCRQVSAKQWGPVSQWSQKA